MAVVTISRQHEALGTEIAGGVARRLGARYVDRELIDIALRQAGLTRPVTPPAEANDHETEQPGFLHRLVEVLSVAVADRRRTLTTPPLPEGTDPEEDSFLRQAMGSDQAYVDVLRSVLERLLLQEPGVVVVGRGGQSLLGKTGGVLHVLICADLSDRIERAARADGVDRQAAAEHVRAVDSGRASYMRRYFGVYWLNPTLYDLVINTSEFTEDQAIELIVTAAGMINA